MSEIALMAPPPIATAADSFDDERECRVCGCTEDEACVTPAGPCSWVESDLCSNCAEGADG